MNLNHMWSRPHIIHRRDGTTFHLIVHVLVHFVINSKSWVVTGPWMSLDLKRVPAMMTVGTKYEVLII